MTRRPARETWPKDTDESQSMPPGQFEIPSARCAGADENRVIPFVEQALHRIDADTAAQFRAKREYVAGFLVDHFFGQAESWDLRADHAARLWILVEQNDLVSERGKVAGDSERRRPCTDAGDTSAVHRHPPPRHATVNVVLEVGGDALQPANCDRLRTRGLVFLNAAPATSGFARAVAGTSKDPGEYIRMPIDHVGIRVTPGGDQSDVFGHRGVGRTRPLTVHDAMKVVGTTDIRRLHVCLLLVRLGGES